MPSVALIHSGKSFLPEVAAYKAYFESLGMYVEILITPSMHQLTPFDILWYFMGLQLQHPAAFKKKFIVHEYASASTPPLARLKDYIKKKANTRPDLRITLVGTHRNIVFPDDGVPLIVRRQGVHDCFYEPLPHTGEYDFIYTGSALAARKTSVWLHGVNRAFPGASVVLTGRHNPGIVNQFNAFKNIHFIQPEPVTALPALLARARFAINFVPDAYPYNIQPSTKLQEYCAAGCRVMSNSYQWSTEFEVMNSAGIFFMANDFSNITHHHLSSVPFCSADMHSYRWENIFAEMELARRIL